MKKLLLLGSVAGPCPPKKQGGTERVAYVQAKELAKRGIQLIFVGGVGTIANFSEQLKADGEQNSSSILKHIEFIEIGGSTQVGNAEGSFKVDPSKMESSRLLRMEMVFLSQVQEVMRNRSDEYGAILNNMRGEAVLLPLAKELQKPFINVMHLPLFPELAEAFASFSTNVITISDSQRGGFPGLKYLATIYNPVNIDTLPFNKTGGDYALQIATIAHHKNQKDSILAAKKAGIPLILAGKIRDKDYFEEEIKPHIDGDLVTYVGEVGFEEKVALYQHAKVFLFPIVWSEPFGLVVIESLACGTPVIAYPNGGPSEIVRSGKNGYLVANTSEMAEKIQEIDTISREVCRQDVVDRFSENVIGETYFEKIKPFVA